MPTQAQAGDFVPERLAEARKRALLSQADLARKAEVSRKTVGNYESGKTQPDEPTLRRLASVVNVPPAWLTGHDSGGDGDSRRTLADFDAEHPALAAPVLIDGRYCVLAIQDAAGRLLYGYTPGGEILAVGSVVGTAISPLG